MAHYLVSFINCIAVEAPEDTSENLIISEAQKWIEHNYRDNPMKMLGGCMDVTADWQDVPCANIESGKFKARVLQEVMDDDFNEDYDKSQVIIREDGTIIHNNHN